MTYLLSNDNKWKHKNETNAVNNRKSKRQPNIHFHYHLYLYNLEIKELMKRNFMFK